MFISDLDFFFCEGFAQDFDYFSDSLSFYYHFWLISASILLTSNICPYIYSWYHFKCYLFKKLYFLKFYSCFVEINHMQQIFKNGFCIQQLCKTLLLIPIFYLQILWVLFYVQNHVISKWWQLCTFLFKSL